MSCSKAKCGQAQENKLSQKRKTNNFSLFILKISILVNNARENMVQSNVPNEKITAVKFHKSTTQWNSAKTEQQYC